MNDRAMVDLHFCGHPACSAHFRLPVTSAVPPSAQLESRAHRDFCANQQRVTVRRVLLDDLAVSNARFQRIGKELQSLRELGTVARGPERNADGLRCDTLDRECIVAHHCQAMAKDMGQKLRTIPLGRQREPEMMSIRDPGEIPDPPAPPYAVL
jgi:hypothetical protein